jgi:geranylgeranyl diphosphate synthase type I
VTAATEPTTGVNAGPAILEAARARLLPPVEAALRIALERRSAPVGQETRATEALPAAGVPSQYGMMRYHLGWLDERLRPVHAPIGKRLRPLICLLAAELCGSSAARAVPAAVALELLHNFTLIHDDIEDGDTLRHHRPTVWALWGEPLAINAGDGMHVLAYLALLDLAHGAVPLPVLHRISTRLAETSLAITEGQHLDLVFERRDVVTPAEYLDMIGRKSAALIACAAAMGGDLAGAPATRVEALAAFGHQLGMGFQMRDDLLGIWGDAGTTGKPAGDLRRRKKTLPSLYALEQARGEDRAAIQVLFAASNPDDEQVALALSALERTGARRHTARMVSRYSDLARAQLATLPDTPARAALQALTDQLETREF